MKQQNVNFFFTSPRGGAAVIQEVWRGGQRLNHRRFNSVSTLLVSKEAELRTRLPSAVRQI